MNRNGDATRRIFDSKAGEGGGSMSRGRVELTAIARSRLREMGLQPPLELYALAKALSYSG